MKPPTRTEMMMKISVYIKGKFVDIMTKKILDNLYHIVDEHN